MSYTSTPVAQGITLINGIEAECCMYLVEGESTALLVDTGMGIENTADLVASMTRLPVQVINTHGHGDHSGGDMYFKSVMLHEKAEPDARDAVELNKTVLPPAQIETIRKILSEGSFQSVYVHEGDVIDLGGRSLEIIEVPGHTSGCIALHDSLTGLLLCGDCLLQAMDILLVVPQALSVHEYLASMKKLEARKDRITGLLTGHDKGIMPISFLEDSVACCEKLVSGELVGDELELPPVFGDTHARRIAYGTIAVSYRPGRL